MYKYLNKINKRFIFIPFFLIYMFIGNLMAQNTLGVINNGDFEDFVFTGGMCFSIDERCSTPGAPFQSCGNRVSNTWGSWWVSHGTPSIYSKNGNNEAMLWSGKWNINEGDETVYGEGLSLNCYDFQAGKVYKMTLRLRTACDGPIENVFILLSNEGKSIEVIKDLYYLSEYPEMTVENYTPFNFSDKQIIWTKSNFLDPYYKTYSFYFIPQKMYNKLYIYPQTTNHNLISYLYIDDAAFNEIEDNEIYKNTSDLPSETVRCNTIQTVGNVSILNGQDVTFKAGNSILLNPGFATQLGAKFKADISPCGTIRACSSGNTK